MVERLHHMDGLRGVAAVVVVCFHLMSALTPGLVAEHGAGGSWVAHTPLAVLWNGKFAVAVFFVLSGFVVTNATLKRGDPIWIDVPIRYLRLAVPATLSVLFAWGLLNAFPNAATELAALTSSPWLAWTYQDSIPGLRAAVYNGLIGIFATGGSFFNNVLWTMRPELIGSIVCFVVCIFRSGRARIVAASAFAAVAVAAGRYEYTCFTLGIFLHEAWAAGRLPSARALPALLAGLVIGSQSGNAAERLGFGRLPAALDTADGGGLLYPLAATLVVYGCMRYAPAARALSGRIGRFLGAVSFPLYLLHAPLIYTVVASVYVANFHKGFMLVVVVAGFFTALFALSHLAERYVERPLLNHLMRLRRNLAVAALLRPS
ncbi:MAG: acyltransferase family protein [Pseudochelatococcus sp.]|jgi:peptidoglycan/LPS O-acetylase OafA/YrhL|uniref:acyltransferase family protein n=1 Tax=Pseudochelatococcus sp. TaxID=2020869 RepID=UPI003D9145B8